MLPLVRTRVIAFVLFAAFAAVLASTPSTSSAETRQPGSGGYDGSGLERAHAHNDYEHDRPLFDALSNDFKSVEADIWLVGGELIRSR
jgi:hypothetical protein